MGFGWCGEVLMGFRVVWWVVSGVYVGIVNC